MTEPLQSFLIEFDELTDLISQSKSKYSEIHKSNLEVILNKEVFAIFEKMSEIFKVKKIFS